MIDRSFSWLPDLSRHGLRYRMAGLYLLSTTILALTIGIISYQLMSDKLQHERDDQLQAQNNIMISGMLSLLEQHSRDLEMLVRDKAVEKYAVSYNELALSQHFNRYKDIFDRIVYANAKGQAELVYTPRYGIDQEALDLSSSELFVLANTESNQVHLGDTMSTKAPGDGIYLGYQTISYFGEKFGYLEARLAPEQLSRKIAAFPQSEDYLRIITDRSGAVIYASHPELTGRRISNQERFITASAGEPEITRSPLLTCDDCFVRAEPIGETHWISFAALPVIAFSRPLREFSKVTFGIFSLVALLMLSIGYRLSTRLIRPIDMLTDTALAITCTEDMKKRVNWSSHDELGHLADAFNLMLDKLERAQTDTLNAKLETENIISSIADPIIVADTAGRIVRHNAAATKLLGYRGAEYLQLQATDCLAPDQELVKATIFGDVLEKGMVNGMETVLLSKEGDRIHVSLSAALIRNARDEVAGTVFAVKDIRSFKQVETHLQYLANHDSLTGLPNRLLFLDRLSQALSRVPRLNRMCGILFLDLDRFKEINDTLGHDAGDALLNQVAKRLRSCVRDSDTVARLGGDEFVILLNDLSGEKNAVMLAEKVITALNQPFELNGHTHTATTSIGISIAPQHGMDAEILMKKADMAMYEAKQQGRNTYCLYIREPSIDPACITE